MAETIKIGGFHVSHNSWPLSRARSFQPVPTIFARFMRARRSLRMQANTLDDEMVDFQQALLAQS